MRKAEKENQKKSGEGKSEEWRLFFIYLIDILNSNNIIGAATRAADLELLFTDFDEQSYRRIASFVEDLPKGYEKIIQGREHDVLLKAFLDLRVKSREGVGDRDVLLAKLRHLKEKGIDDPNIDLFISVITNDVKLLQDALQRGGDQSMTDAQLLRQYEDELRDFRVER